MGVHKNLMGIALFTVLAVWAWTASAVVIVKDNTTVDSIPGLTGFQTDGDEMVGMMVQAIFGNGTNETLSWAATGLNAGGVTGTGWSLTQSGDTFDLLSWTLSNNTESPLLSLVLNGSPGLTVFDTFFGGASGTPGSSTGHDFATNLDDDSFVTATYSNVVALGAAPPVGDLFHLLSVDFGDNGVLDPEFNITQDTDNDSRLNQVPEPSLIFLLGVGLAAMGFARRRMAA